MEHYKRHHAYGEYRCTFAGCRQRFPFVEVVLKHWSAEHPEKKSKTKKAKKVTEAQEKATNSGNSVMIVEGAVQQRAAVESNKKGASEEGVGNGGQITQIIDDGGLEEGGSQSRNSLPITDDSKSKKKTTLLDFYQSEKKATRNNGKNKSKKDGQWIHTHQHLFQLTVRCKHFDYNFIITSFDLEEQHILSALARFPFLYFK